MGSMLRSDKMSLCDMYLQPEAAFEILSQLGEMGCAEFIDMNPEMSALQKKYLPELCRTAEMERKLQAMNDEIEKHKIYKPPLKELPRSLQPNEMIALENELEKWMDTVNEMSTNQVNLMKSFLEMTEMFYVLNNIRSIVGEADLNVGELLSKKAADVSVGARLGVVTGVVERSRSFPFETMLWRISRGNIYYKLADEDKILQDPTTGREIRKVAFVAICQGEQLYNRVEKICNGFRASVYPCPKIYAQRVEMQDQLLKRINDLQQVLKKTNYHRCKTLRNVGRQWSKWMIQVKKAKAVYFNMNLFTLDITKKCLIGQCWVPDQDLGQVNETLKKCSTEIGTNVPSFMLKKETSEIAPTFHRTNKFTNGFQVLINAYGESKYRELNPGLYTIITFPFLFAVMYGDIGHGLIMTAFAAWMVIKEKYFLAQRSTNEIWNIFFGGRYVILLMGIFSIYTGIIYNDCFGKAIRIVNSNWKNKHSTDVLRDNAALSMDPKDATPYPYIFGVDPAWVMADRNKILFQNSLKMKLSIIIGIIHMIFGLVLSLFNHIYFKHYYAIVLEFIPEIIFLTCIFIWLVFLIFFKWWTYSAKSIDVKTGSFCAPQILILFIDMVLLSKTKPISEECDPYMFPNQREIQLALVAVSVCCVPILLFGAPVYVNMKNKKKKEEVLEKMKDKNKYPDEAALKMDLETYSIPFGELMINQGVHTIEYVLSTISHTASYLRLWALSLAHAQLSDMLWSMVLSKLALQDHSAIGIAKLFVIFVIWAAFTTSILVVMEGMSAFLHTLRLHWVEFMSKFFTGGGRVFSPFSFKTILFSDTKEQKLVCAKEKPKMHW